MSIYNSVYCNEKEKKEFVTLRMYELLIPLELILKGISLRVQVGIQ